MAKSIRDNTKKRGRPRTTGKGQMIGVRLHPPLLSDIEDWADDHDLTPPEAIRQLCKIALEKKR